MLYKTKKSFEGNSGFRVLKMMAFLMLRLILKKAKSMVTMSFSEVEEAIDVTLFCVS